MTNILLHTGFSFWESATIGAFGGCFAGLLVWLLNQSLDYCNYKKSKRSILAFMKANNSRKNEGFDYRSTRAIASHTNLTQDKVRYVCSRMKEIRLSTGDKDDMWELTE